MKQIFKIGAFVILAGVVVYQFRSPLSEQVGMVRSSLFSTLAPCMEPIKYSLGSFDTRFDISKEYFLNAVTEAEAIWEKTQEKENYIGRNLFEYAGESNAGALKINLVYDYRQQATEKLDSLGIVVKNNQASYDMLKVKLDALKAQYEKDRNAFNTRVAAFNEKQAAYEENVKYWNSRGGAPAEEYEKLQKTRAELEAESRRIQTLQNDLNEKGEEINALVTVINELIGTLNLSVDKYNTTNTARGESFEEGVYVQEGFSREIDIYEFSSREKLVRVLAHELGHALGLDHVEDEEAIMYELNQENSLTLTPADLIALKTKCGIE